LTGAFRVLFGDAAAFFFFQSLLMAFGGYGLCARKGRTICIVAACVATMNCRSARSSGS
jgi:hypothetical protein